MTSPHRTRYPEGTAGRQRAGLRRLFPLLAILLTTQVWAAEPASPAPAPTPPNFDLRRNDPTDWVWSVPDPVPFVTHGEVHSRSMDRPIGYNIYLPPEYEAHPDWRFSVVYFLHGARSDEKGGAGLAKVAERERAAGRTGPVIWVFINGGPVSGYYDWPDSYVKVETYFLEELIPAIEARYRTRTDRAGRAICGYSMGGNGAVRLATKYPDRFCAVSAIAGAFGTGRSLAVNDNVEHWTRTNIDRIRGRLPMHFYVGAEDRLLANQAAYHAVLHELRLGYRATVIEGRGHQIGEMWTEVCPDFVRTIAQACAAPQKEG
jgi:S-formylglutathione hydrolase FrmB